MCSLACKTVDFTDQNIEQRGDLMELNFEGLKMQKWNVPTDRIQIVDEKNEVICLVIMFTKEDLSVALKYFVQAVTNFLLSSAENTNKAMFYILMTISLEVNMIFTISKHFNPIFSSTLCELYLFISCISRTSKFHFRVPHLPYVLVCKIHIYSPMMTLWSLLT